MTIQTKGFSRGGGKKVVGKVYPCLIGSAFLRGFSHALCHIVYQVRGKEAIRTICGSPGSTYELYPRDYSTY